MGEVFRRFWLPALLSSELPEPDGPHFASGYLVKTWLPFGIPMARLVSSIPHVPTVERTCSSAAMRKAASGACTMDGSST